MRIGIARIGLALGGLLALAAPAAPRAVDPAAWTLVDLGTLGGSSSYGAAVSDDGYVAGCSLTASGAVHAFLYRDGTMADLDPAGEAGDSCALAVNDRGMAAGRSGSGELVVWDGSRVTRLGVKGNVGAINGRGEVVGSYATAAGDRAFRYRDGVLQDLGALAPGAASAAYAVNERGEVAGQSNGRAFLYRDGLMRDLGTLGGGNSIAKGINERGEVVGMASDAHGVPTPFIFDGAMRALPGPSESEAIDINQRGTIVGSGEGVHGFVLAGATSTLLQSLPAAAASGWHHFEPTGVNNRGWIVGTAFNTEGEPRAFLLVPGERTAKSR
jgi:probable HAF family extracellular repeat protein